MNNLDETKIPEVEQLKHRWELSQKQMLLYSRDFARVYRAEKARREMLELLHNKLRSIVDCMSDGMIAVNEKFQILDANKTFERMFGVVFEDIRGQHLQKVLRDEMLLLNLKHMREQNRNFVSLEMQTGKEKEQFFEVNISRITGRHEERKGYVLLFQDVTEKMRFDRIKSRFITFASHEIRTPLHGLLGFLNLIYENLRDRMNAEEQKHFQFLLDSGENLRTVVEEMLEMSTLKKEETKIRKRDVPVAELIREAVSRVALEQEAMSVHVTFEEPPEALTIFCEPDLLSKSFESILKNIIIYTLPEGKVTVSVAEEPEKISLEFCSPEITLSREEVELLMNDFYNMDTQITRGADGLELGFPLANDIVQWHGGRLLIPDSDPFSIVLELPRNNAKKDEESDAITAERKGTGNQA